MKIELHLPKPRNPLVAAAHRRLAGAHATAGNLPAKALRRQGNRQLRHELQRVDADRRSP